MLLFILNILLFKYKNIKVKHGYYGYYFIYVDENGNYRERGCYLNLPSTIYQMSKCGLEVSISDSEAFKRKFYAERAKARNEGCFDFDCLQLCSPPPDVIGKLWIIKLEEKDSA